MINLNGNLQVKKEQNIADNRGFLYGDALFDTMIYKNDTLVFIESHYFRLLAGMRQLRIEIPVYFTQDYWEKEIRKTILANKYREVIVRTSVFRNSLGLYMPESNDSHYIIQTRELTPTNSKTAYHLGIYNENYLNTSPVSSIKTNNRIVNILAAIFSKENNFDNCLLLNHRKHITEAINANVFLVFDNQIITPPLSEGSINGIIREKIITIVKKHKDLQMIERKVETHDLQKANEVFLTNSVVGIQAVRLYKRKQYNTDVSKMLFKELEVISFIN